jgi:hypothetical protein
MLAYFISRVAVGLHILSIVVNGQGKEVIPCDRQVWILKITDAIGTQLSLLSLYHRLSPTRYYSFLFDMNIGASANVDVMQLSGLLRFSSSSEPSRSGHPTAE